MEPTLTWLDLTARDRDKMRRVLDLFSEQGTVDEMGLGSLRDALSDALFPGTSSIQTRLRYFLFVPWIYQQIEGRRVASGDVTRLARQAELELIGPLSESEDEGVIGARAGKKLTRLPSSVYWAGLMRWGLFMPDRSQGWYHTHFASLVRGRDEVGRADDPGVVWTREPTWHPRLPKAPAGFPQEIYFALTHAESDFLRGRIEERCKGSLLAWLAREGNSSPADSFWDDPHATRTDGKLQELVELARRFSLHVEGAPLLYNLLLALRYRDRHGGGEERIGGYQAELAEWAAREDEEEAFDPNVLWAFLAERGDRLAEPQRRFVEAWSGRLRAIGAEAAAQDRFLHELIEQRERKLKGGRARLANDGRLLDWNGRVGVGRMDFRWFRVRQLLTDLHLGLES